MMKPLSRRFLSTLLALGLITALSAPAAADAIIQPGIIDASPVTVTGAASALIISITHPTVVAWDINVNLASPFTAPGWSITNHSPCPVDVTLTRLDKNRTSTLPFQDVAPDTFTDWAAIDKAQSLANLALGVKIKGEGSAWLPGYSTQTYWASESGSTFLGTLPGEGSGMLELEARHGLAFDTAYTALHDLTLLFTLN